LLTFSEAWQMLKSTAETMVQSSSAQATPMDDFEP
jgi:hypothetical protein